ncbi:MAG: AAA family ATPase [Prochloraceae cyanobacterium]|nr:AAA family ATPase [Prochloraceae cyanobacterium]
MPNKPIQKILFGNPGTGKSHRIRFIAEDKLGLKWDERYKTINNTIKTVFHPEYTYSDFMGKLLPQTTGKGEVIYKYYPGHFLRALGIAYKNIIKQECVENALLVIDELNRGNAAAIFGSVFQLLDRDEDYWSSYEIHISELEKLTLLKLIGYQIEIGANQLYINGRKEDIFFEEAEHLFEVRDDYDGLRVFSYLKKQVISLPRNLSIIATINTCDESIYYLDSAFKRRWDWQYVSINDSISQKYDSETTITIENTDKIKDLIKWSDFVLKLNHFIIEHQNLIRNIEDKQIGYWFIKAEENKIKIEAIKNKLMFYLWDSVFSRNKKPLEDILSGYLGERDSITYAKFQNYCQEFIQEIDREYSVMPDQSVLRTFGF